MFCYHCGKEIEDNSRFCLYCGQDQTVAGNPVESGDTAVLSAVPANPVSDNPFEMTAVMPAALEPLDTEPPASLVEELSRIMKPADPGETTVLAVEIPDIPEVPRAPIPPLETFAPTTPDPVPQTPPQPAIPAVPVAPVYTPAPAYAPAVPAQQPNPPRKKTWMVWLSVALAAVLVVGSVLAVLLLGGSGYKKTVESLAAVAFDGDFSQIEDLAPAEFWSIYAQVTSPSEMTYQGDVWKFTVLPTKLQEEFGSKTDMHYDSFRMPSQMEIRSDEEATLVEQQTIKTWLVLYGISTNRIGEVRKLKVEINIAGMSNGIKQELCLSETMIAVEIDDKWYLLNEDGTFAVNRIVEGVLKEIR